MTPDATHPRLLILEDEIDIARLICKALDGYGFRCAMDFKTPDTAEPAKK